MTTLEEIFNASVLDVIAPVASLGLPNQDDVDAANSWLDIAEAETTDRKIAFFDENLDFLLTVRFESFSNDTPQLSKPPIALLSYLAHIQVSYDASYISSLPSAVSSEIGQPPPRTISIAKSKPSTLAAAHPSIFPPHTPHPIPSTTESDRQYVQAQGTLLRSGIWGENILNTSGGKATDAFALFWSKREKAWIAVFKMSVQVSFMPTSVSDPLLCLTVSATLREKPLAITPPRKTLAALIEAAGGLPSAIELGTPTKGNGEDDDDDNTDLIGLDEVNILEGLAAGPTFSDPTAPLRLPSTRLGSSIRRDVFSLPALTGSPSSPDSNSSPTMSRGGGGSHPTLRKSFRKTLRTVSGFRVRMRTVFVPYFMLPQSNGARKHTNGRSSQHKAKPDAKDDDDDDDSDSDSDPEEIHERELREAGNDEHTVILCVEVENSGESSAGFSVQNVDVSVGGEGAQTRLIGWGEIGLSQPDKVFPLLLGPKEQYNLLYAVSFLRSPETDEFSLARGRGLPGAPHVQELQRAVTIIIKGRPFESITDDANKVNESNKLVYPTPVFPSRWNCILDLSSQAQAQSLPDHLSATGTTDPFGTLAAQNDAHPTPASPFPASGPRSGLLSTGQASGLSRPNSTTPMGKSGTTASGTPTPSANPTAIAGSKRHTFSAMDAAAAEMYITRPPASPVNYRSGTSMLNPANQRDTQLQSGIAQSGSPIAAGAPNPIVGLLPSSATTMNNRHSYLPPSVNAQSYVRSPTTYGPLSPPLPPIPYGGFSSFSSFGIPKIPRGPGHIPEDSMSSEVSFDTASMVPPPTPAYPAYPTSPMPPPLPSSSATATTNTAPHWQGPISNLQSGEVGPSVEIRREKGGGGIPATPGPRVGTGGGGFAQMQMQMPLVGEGSISTKANGGQNQAQGEPIVISVGLLSPSHRRKHKGGDNNLTEPESEFTRGLGKIYPLDQFTLDIFVFNQSSWTRRFEVSYPDRRKRRKEEERMMLLNGGQLQTVGEIQRRNGDEDTPGIIPLENRVRIGPLLPSTCQSVRMDFLALTPGVHSVDTLTLTDTQTGYTMNLRSVVDVVVHEHETAERISGS